MNKNNLYFFIKLPRSGGSTIAKAWSKHEISFDNNGNIIKGSLQIEPRVVVCGDEWRLALGHRYNSWVEPIIHSHIQVAARALLRNHSVLIDETNTNKNSILKWLEEDLQAIPVLINTDVNVCKDRAMKTNQPDLLPIIDRMNINLSRTFGVNLDVINTVNKLREEARIRHSFNRIVV